ncbi:hypothetical protein [Cytobacillus sp.]|uniref:hypothetical protein n=1 Tax=Cytobacillus sp. TaxID=2675269 RepID=UPI003513B845
MHEIGDIVFLNDISKLPKETLQDICTDLTIDTSGTSADLANRVWEYVQKNRRKQDSPIKASFNKLLAGKTSVSWFELENETSLVGLKDKIIKGSKFNPFTEIKLPQTHELTTEPVLFAAANGEKENQYFLRYAYRNGVRRHTDFTEVNFVPRSDVATVYIDEESGLIEVRTDSKNSQKVASSLAKLVQQQITLEQKKVLAPFGNKVGLIADRLKGEMIDTTSTPELIFDDLEEEHTKSIIEILNALNTFFDEDDETELVNRLRQASDIFGEHLLTVPFTALILCGMEKVGMRTTVGDLRNQPLYVNLAPHLQNQGGFIKFDFPISGVERSFTIRVGKTTNSVSFTTPATEEVIKFVRERIILNQTS